LSSWAKNGVVTCIWKNWFVEETGFAYKKTLLNVRNESEDKVVPNGLYVVV
jgi:hypothetical protein